MKVEQGNRVKLEYELKVEHGEVIESSAARGPLVYTHGVGKMLPGLESRIEGLSVGDEKEGVIPPSEAYGTEEMLPTKTIPTKEFPSTEEIKVGNPFEASDVDGNPIRFTVIKIEKEQVTVRFEHPLAGKAISFKVKILDISEPI